MCFSGVYACRVCIYVWTCVSGENGSQATTTTFYDCSRITRQPKCIVNVPDWFCIEGNKQEIISNYISVSDVFWFPCADYIDRSCPSSLWLNAVNVESKRGETHWLECNLRTSHDLTRTLLFISFTLSFKLATSGTIRTYMSSLNSTSGLASQVADPTINKEQGMKKKVLTQIPSR